MKKIFYFIGILFIVMLFALGFGKALVELKSRYFQSEKKVEITSPDKNSLEQKKTEDLPGKVENISEEKMQEEIVREEDVFSDVEKTEKINEIQPEIELSFAILGDTQRFQFGDVNGGLQKAVKNVSAKNVDLVMATGDLLSSCEKGCVNKLNEWKKTLGLLVSKTYVTMGNHDRTGKEDADKAWQESFALPQNGPSGYKEFTYSFDFKNTHFIVLNSAKPKEHVVNKVQRDWLEADLIANKKENTFVFFHEPAYPVSNKIDEGLDVEKKDRDALWGILSRYNVTAVFSGHEHIFSRKKIGSIYQFVFGNTDSFNHDTPKAGMAEFSYVGENFGIISVKGKDITVDVYSADGALINSFNFSK